MFIVKATRWVPSTMGTGRKTNLKLEGYVKNDDGDSWSQDQGDAAKYDQVHAEKIAQEWRDVGWETEVLPAP